MHVKRKFRLSPLRIPTVKARKSILRVDELHTPYELATGDVDNVKKSHARDTRSSSRHARPYISSPKIVVRRSVRLDSEYLDCPRKPPAPPPPPPSPPVLCRNKSIKPVRVARMVDPSRIPTIDRRVADGEDDQLKMPLRVESQGFELVGDEVVFSDDGRLVVQARDSSLLAGTSAVDFGLRVETRSENLSARRSVTEFQRKRLDDMLMQMLRGKYYAVSDGHDLSRCTSLDPGEEVEKKQSGKGEVNSRTDSRSSRSLGPIIHSGPGLDVNNNQAFVEVAWDPYLATSPREMAPGRSYFQEARSAVTGAAVARLPSTPAAEHRSDAVILRQVPAKDTRHSLYPAVPHPEALSRAPNSNVPRPPLMNRINRSLEDKAYPDPPPLDHILEAILTHPAGAIGDSFAERICETIERVGTRRAETEIVKIKQGYTNLIEKSDKAFEKAWRLLIEQQGLAEQWCDKYQVAQSKLDALEDEVKHLRQIASSKEQDKEVVKKDSLTCVTGAATVTAKEKRSSLERIKQQRVVQGILRAESDKAAMMVQQLRVMVQDQELRRRPAQLIEGIEAVLHASPPVTFVSANVGEHCKETDDTETGIAAARQSSNDAATSPSTSTSETSSVSVQVSPSSDEGASGLGGLPFHADKNISVVSVTSFPRGSLHVMNVPGSRQSLPLTVEETGLGVGDGGWI